MAYAFGGPVLFQSSNIIYLVGAAWLPLGFRAVDRWLRLGRRIALAELAVVLAMEILGGDLESAYLIGVSAAGYAAALAYGRGHRGPAATGTDGADSRGRRRQVPVVLGVGLFLTIWVVGTLALGHWASGFPTVATGGRAQASLPWSPWVGPLVWSAWGLAGLALLVRWLRIKKAGARPVLAPMLFGLVAAAALAAGLSAAQLLPMAEFALQSTRGAADGLQDVYGFSRLIAWTESSTSDRAGEFVDWARRTAEPKYGINYGVQYSRTLGATELYDYAWYFGGFYYGAREKAARVLGVEPGTPILAHSRRAFDMWNTRYFILPYYAQWGDVNRGIASFLEQTERIHPPVDAFLGAHGRDRELDWIKHHDYQVRRNRNEYPRAWVVHEARSLPPIHGLGRAGRSQPMMEMLFSNDMSWPDPARIAYDPHRYVWLEASVGPGLAEFLSGGYPSSGEVVRVVRHEPDIVELDAVLERAGIVILADVHYPGWTLTIDGQPAPIYRANRMMRGAAVAEGRHTLVYTYRPASFRIDLIVSVLGIGALGLLTFWSTRST